MSYLSCRLCEKEFVFTSNLCIKCRRVKHLLNIYGDDVYHCLEECLVRDRTKQDFKIKKINKKGLDTPKDNNSILCDTSNDREYITPNLNESIKLYKNVSNNVIAELKERITNV